MNSLIGVKALFNRLIKNVQSRSRLYNRYNSSTGATALFESLVENKVTNVWGYPGGAILPVLDKFHGQNKINYILSRTEAGGSFMAEGYSKATKKPGIVMVTSGPGAINTMTSLQNALSDGTPLMVLSGQVSTAVIGTDAFQEADVIGISKPCTKWNNQITDGKTVNNTVRMAFKQMLDKRHGPVLIDLPKNVMSNSYEQNPVEESKETTNDKLESTITPEDINKMINQSKRPVILAGQGVMQGDAIHELRRIATFYNIPVTTTLMGLGVFNERSCQSLKMVGMHGSYYANMAVQNCDLLINFGSRFDDRIIGNPSKFAPKATIVHVDILSKNINKVIKTNYYINNDCKTVLNDMIEYTIFNDNFDPYKFNEWNSQIHEWKKIAFSYPIKKNVLQGRHVIATLNKIIYDDMCNSYTIVADVGAHQMWAAQFIDYCYPKVKWITSGGLGSMGYSVPAAIGAKVGLDKGKVISICGDGGFTMSMTEILTAVENKVNIKVLIINNSYQLMVKMWQDKFYDKRYVGVKMNNPPFELVCEAMGCKGIRIDINDNLEEKLRQVLDYEDGPIVANIITDDSESVLPMVSPGKALDDMIIDEDNNDKIEGDAPC
jgi:acetolactate synthase-1/2/3 large subunit